MDKSQAITLFMLQFNDMISAAQRAQQLESKVTQLSKDTETMMQLQLELKSETARADSAEAARNRYQRELMEAIADTANFSDQVEALKSDVSRLQKQARHPFTLCNHVSSNQHENSDCLVSHRS